MRKCGGCDHTDLQSLFSLGDIPPVNAFLLPSEVKNEIGYPLELFFCKECTLIQLGDCVPPEKLFSNYLHLSSASESNIQHLKEVADWVAERDSKKLQDKKVLEIGSNDGTLLSFLKNHTANVVGMDPAQNLAAEAKKRGVRTYTDFFLQESAAKLVKTEGQFDWIVALNVVPHTPQFISLLKGARGALAPGGRMMIEGAYVVETILNGQFDTIYHEHVYNFSIHSLNYAMKRVGLQILDVEIIPTQGTSFRVLLARDDDPEQASGNLKKLLGEEKQKGMTDVKTLAKAAEKIKAFPDQLKAKLKELRKKSASPIIGLGAPARGVVILNYCKLNTDDLQYIIDDTVLKQGRLTPGVHIPVAGWDHAPIQPGQVFLLLSWNYRKEMIKKLNQRQIQGTLLIPFPHLEEVKIG